MDPASHRTDLVERDTDSRMRSLATWWLPPRHCVLMTVLLAVVPAGRAFAHEQDPGGKIVLDVPVRQAGSPEDSKEHVTLVVGGMKKSRSGAT